MCSCLQDEFLTEKDDRAFALRRKLLRRWRHFLRRPPEGFTVQTDAGLDYLVVQPWTFARYMANKTPHKEPSEVYQLSIDATTLEATRHPVQTWTLPPRHVQTSTTGDSSTNAKHVHHDALFQLCSCLRCQCIFVHTATLLHHWSDQHSYSTTHEAVHMHVMTACC